MSNHKIAFKDQNTNEEYSGCIGWDKPLATYFASVFNNNESLDEPIIWLGTQFAQYPELEPFLKDLHQRAKEMSISTLVLPDKIEHLLTEEKEQETAGKKEDLLFHMEA